MNRNKLIIFILLTSLMVGTISAQEVSDTVLYRNAGLCYCIPVVEDVQVYQRPGRTVADTLVTGSPVRLGNISGNWVNVFFTPEIDTEVCNGTMTHTDSGWVRLSDFPHSALLAENFIPLMGNGTEPLFAIFRVAENDFWNEFAIRGKDAGILAEISQTLKPGLNEIAYAVIYSGVPEYPYALFYSGQMSPTYIDPPELVLFGRQDIKTWYPQDGYRVWAELKEVGPEGLTIREAFAFRTKIDVKLAWNKGDIQRVFGVFPEGSGRWPEATRDADSLDSLLLSQPVDVFESKSKENLISSLNAGIKAEVHLLEVDYPAKAVYLKVNEWLGWAELEVIRALLLPIGDDGDY